MHERGMLHRIDHPDLGNVVVPSTSIRLHGAGQPPMVPSPRLGQHNDAVYGDWLGLSGEERDTLKAGGVI